MQIINAVQGSPEWHAHRAQSFNASDAPAMLGCSPYKTREQLLRELATGVGQQHDDRTQRRFDDGHRYEALARPLAEELIGDDLFPVTGTNGRYSASFDGITMDETTLFEHKSLNNELRNVLTVAATGAELPLHYRVQMEHQLIVSEANRVLFMATQWTDDDVLVEKRWCWYEPDVDLREKIVRGWEQFEQDLAAYVPPVIDAPAAKVAVTTLPAVSVRVDGALAVRHNFALLETRMREFIEGLPKQPATDDEFGIAESAVKTLATAEDAIKAAIDGAVAQSTSLEEAVRAGRLLQELSRNTRLALEKLVKARKDAIRAEIVAGACEEVRQHVAALNARLGAEWVQRPPSALFGESIKGLKTVASVRAKCAQAVADAKIATSALADTYDANRKQVGEWMTLFPDFASVGSTAPALFGAVVEQRIAKHKEAEAERQRKAAELAAAQERQRAIEALGPINRAAVDAHQNAQREKTGSLPGTPGPYAGNVAQAAQATPSGAGEGAHAEQRAPEPPTLKIGEMCRRLGFTVSREFIETTIGFKSAATEKSWALWHDSQWDLICNAISAHVLRVGGAK